MPKYYVLWLEAEWKENDEHPSVEIEDGDIILGFSEEGEEVIVLRKA